MRVVVTERAEAKLERAYDYGFAEFGINAVIRLHVLLGVFKLIYCVDTEKDSVIITDLWDARMEQHALAEDMLRGDRQ